jgi:hypothetical protein
MEGYLFKKGRGDSSLGRHNWKKRWVVLEERTITYYEDLDKNGQPIGLKGTVNIKDAEIVPEEHKEKQYTFMVKPQNDSAILFQAPDLKSYNGNNVHVSTKFYFLYVNLSWTDHECFFCSCFFDSICFQLHCSFHCS